MRVATTVVGRLETVPVRAATPAQRLLLGVATAQLQAAASRILMAANRLGRDSEESSLGDLVARTLALANEALAGPPELKSPGVEPALLAACATEPAARLGDGEREV